MRLSLLIAVIALTCSCSAAVDPATHEPPPNEYSTAPSTPPSHGGGHPAVDRRDVPEGNLLGADLDALPGAAKLLVEVEPTVDAAVEPSHEPKEQFEGHSPFSTPPSRFDDPQAIFIWVGHAMLNYGPEQPFPDPRLQVLLDPALAKRRFETETSRSTVNASRAVLLDTWINDESSTTTLATGVAVFERTLRTRALAEPRIEIVTIDLTAHLIVGGWQIIEVQVSSQ